MKYLFIVLLFVSGVAWACSSNSFMGSDGKVHICITCCTGENNQNCVTTCN